MTKKVVAIVVTYNRKELLVKVLNSLIVQTYPLYKIIVIDNDSNDGTHGYLSKHLMIDNVEYFNTGDNLGGAGGFYYGFKQADKYCYDYLWLMDDDFQPTEQCLEYLLKGDPSGIVQPVRYNLDDTCAEISAVTYDLSNPFVLSPKGQTVKDYLSGSKIKSNTIDIAVMPFEGPLIPKVIIEKIGYPEGKYFIFGDDTDYAIRALRQNFSIKCNLDAKAYRLLINHQKNDLKSWKGYFMLRNLFHIHYKYGTNIFVKYKPWLLALGYAAQCFIKRDFSQINIIWCALRDSKILNNTELFKPGVKR